MCTLDNFVRTYLWQKIVKNFFFFNLSLWFCFVVVVTYYGVLYMGDTATEYVRLEFPVKPVTICLFPLNAEGQAFCKKLALLARKCLRPQHLHGTHWVLSGHYRGFCPLVSIVSICPPSVWMAVLVNCIRNIQSQERCIAPLFKYQKVIVVGFVLVIKWLFLNILLYMFSIIIVALTGLCTIGITPRTWLYALLM